MRVVLAVVILSALLVTPAAAIEPSDPNRSDGATVRKDDSVTIAPETDEAVRQALEALHRLRLRPGVDAATPIAPVAERPER